MNRQGAKTLTPVGIGGWLILVAVGLCLTPVRIAVELVRGLRPLEPATWHAITTPGTRAYQPLFGLLIVGELVVNAALLIWAGLLLYLFLAKRRPFPAMMITFMITRVVFQAADLGVALMIPAAAARIGPAVYGALAAGVLVTLVWVPYFIRSHRVQSTFTRLQGADKGHLRHLPKTVGPPSSAGRREGSRCEAAPEGRRRGVARLR